ncbi:hypothetical protein SH1V18_36530 [Vallitalea longa]|uniref:Uncharacterized protein n=2 Tax=Vallitalea longa TaxID=2936439 RepID=A0A9W6DH81_9FIRM|nr:hypothetical protein SH1V18_36530 [Vallitalea longa]
MFNIKYELLDSELNRLRETTDLKEFELDVNEVVGQFQLSVNDRVEGFVDKDIPYEGEFVSEWIYLLNESIQCLDEEGFVSISAPDSNNIRYELELNSEGLIVKKIRALPKQILEHICIEPVEQAEFFWKEIVSAKAFSHAVLEVTEQFLTQVEKANPFLLELEILLRLKQSFLKSKDIVLTA